MTEASFPRPSMPGWPGIGNATHDPRRTARLVTDSGNWPIPLVTRREAARQPDFDAEWFSRDSASFLEDQTPEEGPVFVVSRTRLRLARALFALAFLGVLALLAFELHLYFTGQVFRFPGR